MRGKELVLSVIRTYFAVVALVCAANAIMGAILAPDQTFGYDAFLSPLICGLAGTLPTVVTYSSKELSVKQLLFRKVIQLLLIEASVLFVMFYGAAESFKQPKIIISVAVSIIIIYIIIDLIELFQDHLSAKKMTEELIAFQQSVNKEE